MALLFHGTTQLRAEHILRHGPDPDYVEPGGDTPAENWSACLTFGPFECVDAPETYACGKSRAASEEGREEGGPALLVVDVHDDVIALAVDEWLPLTQGFVQFDPGAGLEELRAAWPTLEKRVIPLSCP